MSSPAKPVSADAGERFPSRDLRSDSELGRTLMALEAPECDCKPEHEHACPGPGLPGGCSEEVLDDCPCCAGKCKCSYKKLHICATRRLGERCPKNYLAVDRCTCCYGESGKSKDGKSCWCTVLRRRCKHVLEADHNLPLQDWLELLLLYDRAGHAEPPLPRPAGALSREGRLALMEERAAAGLAIFSPRDVRAGEDEQVSVQALKGRRQGGLIR